MRDNLFSEIKPYELSTKPSSVAMLISELLETQELVLRRAVLEPEVRAQLEQRHELLLNQSKFFLNG